MKTTVSYLAFLFLFLFLNVRAQEPGDSKSMPTKSSKGKHELKKEEKRAMTEKRHRENLQRKGTQRFITGRHNDSKAEKRNLHEKRRMRKRAAKADKDSQGNIRTKALYTKGRKTKHRHKKNVEK